MRWPATPQLGVVLLFCGMGLMVLGVLRADDASSGVEIYPVSSSTNATPQANTSTTPKKKKKPTAFADTASQSSEPTAGTSSLAADSTTKFATVVLLDPSLKQKLRVLQVQTDLTVNHLLTVRVQVKNRLDEPLRLEMQTVYKDHAGILLNPEVVSWLPMSLHAYEKIDYHSEALTRNAEGYEVRIRLEPIEQDDDMGPGSAAEQLKRENQVHDDTVLP